MLMMQDIHSRNPLSVMPAGSGVPGIFPEELSAPVGIAVGRVLARRLDEIIDGRLVIALAIGVTSEVEVGAGPDTVTYTPVVVIVVVSSVT